MSEPKKTIKAILESEADEAERDYEATVGEVEDLTRELAEYAERAAELKQWAAELRKAADNA